MKSPEKIRQVAFLRRVVALTALLPVSAAVVALEPIRTAPSPWVLENQQMSDFASRLDADAAGCVVAGLHIGKDGRVVRAQVLQGAFTARLSSAEQVEVQKAIQSDLMRWTFRPRKRNTWLPVNRFEMFTVGFVPARSEESNRTVIGPSRQHAALGKSCEIGSLADWGERNAIPVEQAMQRNSDDIIVSEAGDGRLLWVSAPVKLTPPRYPPVAYANGVGGCVRIAYVVREDGSTDRMKLLSVDPSPANGGSASLAYGSRREQAVVALGQVSLLAVSQWKFAPGPDNLERRPALMSSPLSFSVGGPMPKDCEDAATVAEVLGGTDGA
jgi:hypothetical protein